MTDGSSQGALRKGPCGRPLDSLPCHLSPQILLADFLPPLKPRSVFSKRHPFLWYRLQQVPLSTPWCLYRARQCGAGWAKGSSRNFRISLINQMKHRSPLFPSSPSREIKKKKRRRRKTGRVTHVGRCLSERVSRFLPCTLGGPPVSVFLQARFLVAQGGLRRAGFLGDHVNVPCRLLALCSGLASLTCPGLLCSSLYCMSPSRTPASRDLSVSKFGTNTHKEVSRGGGRAMPRAAGP